MELLHKFDPNGEVKGEGGEVVYAGPLHQYDHPASGARALVPVSHPGLIDESEARVLGERAMLELLFPSAH